MKLAIFGDSFADDQFFKNEYKNNDTSWVDVIRNSRKYEVSNFSEKGASLWWCYQQFLKHHSNFEKIIFLITFPNRITLPETTGLKIRRHQQPYNVELNIKFSKPDKLKFWNVIKDYYDHIHDRERELCFHDLLVEKIKQIRPDTVLYPCSKRSIPDSQDLSLLEIIEYEDESWGGYNRNYRDSSKDDTRMCHMIEENNLVIGQMFLDKLEGKTTHITKKDLVSPTKSRDYYLTDVHWGT